MQNSKPTTMKKTILTVTIVIAGLFASAVLITSCGGKKDQATEEHHHEEGDTTAHHDEMDSTQMAYACPMHPEVTGKAGDACSKCGMKLVAVNADSTKVHGEHEH